MNSVQAHTGPNVIAHTKSDLNDHHIDTGYRGYGRVRKMGGCWNTSTCVHDTAGMRSLRACGDSSWPVALSHAGACSWVSNLSTPRKAGAQALQRPVRDHIGCQRENQKEPVLLKSDILWLGAALASCRLGRMFRTLRVSCRFSTGNT